MNINSKLRFNKIKIYSVFMAFLPIIAIYSFGIPGLNAADLILVIFLFMSIYDGLQNKGIYNKENNIIFYILLFYIILFSLISAVMTKYIFLTESIIRVIRICFYIIVVVYTSRRYLDTSITKKWVIRISIIATIYLIVQYILYYVFGNVLKGFLSFIPIYLTEYSLIDYNEIYKIHFFRPTSFFLEPALYAQYVLMGLAISLFSYKENMRNNILKAIFITLGIIMSTSAQGLILSLLCWGIFCVKKVVDRKINKNMIIILIIFILAVPVVGYKIYNTEIVQNTISRIYREDSDGTDAYSARFSGFNEYSKIEEYQYKIIGYGYGVVPNNVWMSSGAYMLYGTGIIGFVLSISLFLKFFKDCKKIDQKIINLIYLCLFFGTSIFNNYMFVFYFSIILYGDSFNRRLENEKNIIYFRDV